MHEYVQMEFYCEVVLLLELYYVGVWSASGKITLMIAIDYYK